MKKAGRKLLVFAPDRAKNERRRKIKKMVMVLVLAIGLLVSGCASILSGTSQTLRIRSEEPNTKFYAVVSGTEVELSSSTNGTYATTSIPKKDLKETVLKATKQGCSPVLTKVERKFDPVSLCGLLVDYGLISILIVDWAATGAIMKADPEDYILTPNCRVGNDGSPTWINVGNELKKRKEAEEKALKEKEERDRPPDIIFGNPISKEK